MGPSIDPVDYSGSQPKGLVHASEKPPSKPEAESVVKPLQTCGGQLQKKDVEVSSDPELHNSLAQLAFRRLLISYLFTLFRLRRTE